MIDNIDIQILQILQENGRASASDISKAVNLSVPAISDRIKKLTDKGIIDKFVAILNHKNSGLDLTAYVFIVSKPIRIPDVRPTTVAPNKSPATTFSLPIPRLTELVINLLIIK